MLKRGVDLRSAGGSKPLEPIVEGEDVCHGDLRDPAVVDRLLQGVDVLIHMAGTSVERPLPEIIENNLVALQQVYEGARRHGVKRILFASSNHAIGMHTVAVGTGARLRIPGPTGSMASARSGARRWPACIGTSTGSRASSVRIGSCLERPTEFRHLSTWLGHEDFLQMMMQAITVPTIGYLTVWGVSANTRSYWDNTGAERLGYEPVQNAEDYASEILKQPNPLEPGSPRSAITAAAS